MSASNGYPSDQLRARIVAGPPVLAAGCHDALSARLATEAGFDALHLSGAIVGATTFGLPDLGFTGATDMLDALRRVTAGSSIPVIVDADTGYGDVLQVAETTRRYEQAGAAALHLEDQVLPKRCGHMDGTRLVELPTAQARIRAAVDARRRLLVIARTDALGVAGADEALRRVCAFADAGADAVFVEGAGDAETVAAAREAARGLPVVVNCSEAGRRPDPTPKLAKSGARLLLFPVASALAGAAAMRATYREIREHGVAPEPSMPWSELTDLLGLPALTEDERRWQPTPLPKALTQE